MFLLKSKDVDMAKFDGNFELIEVYRRDLLPLHFKYGRGLKSWIESRAIDSSRVSSRLLKKALQMRNKDDYSTSMKVYARAITDTFWVCPDDADISYSDVQFTSDEYSDLTLNLDINVLEIL